MCAMQDRLSIDGRRNERRFSLFAYLASVAGGCLLVGIFYIVHDAAVGARPHPYGPLMAPATALVIGISPASLICLPLTLASFWAARRFGLHSPVWYLTLGAFTGLGSLLPFVVSTASSFATAVSPLAVFSAAGAGAGLVYFWVEQAEARWRLKRLANEPRP